MRYPVHAQNEHSMSDKRSSAKWGQTTFKPVVV